MSVLNGKFLPLRGNAFLTKGNLGRIFIKEISAGNLCKLVNNYRIN